MVVRPEGVVAVESAFDVLDALGTEVDSLRKNRDEPLTVTGFFETPPDEHFVKSVIEDARANHNVALDAIITIAHRTVEETDWLAEWKKYWKPTTVGRFVVTPPWEAVDDAAGIAIVIEPNMAFGTGTHETTQLCLRAIGERYEGGQSFLDVGTGTGILSIAAAKLGASGIEAFDTDADSIKIARENAKANGVADEIKFIDGPIDDQTRPADFVVANLTLDVITPILPLLIEKARQILLLSGILAEQCDSIEYELRKTQILDFRLEIAGEWCSVLIER